MAKTFSPARFKEVAAFDEKISKQFVADTFIFLS